jgi:predicted nucleic acid-binding protein
VRAYLDASVLIAYLYGEIHAPERFVPTRQLFTAIEEQRLEAVVTFYALQELHAFVKNRWLPSDVDETFRIALLELVRLPLIVVPYVERTQLNLWRRQFEIKDSSDVFHVVAALVNDCDALVAYDRHFLAVADLIPAYTPEELLALPTRTEGDNAGSGRGKEDGEG